MSDGTAPLDGHNHLYLRFESIGNPSIKLDAIGLEGEASLDALFKYRVLLRHLDGLLGDEDVDKIIRAGCKLTTGHAPYDIVHGLVSEIEIREAYEGEPAYYLATVVPQVWLLGLSKVNRVFQNKSVVQMARTILQLYGLTEGPEGDFEIRIAETPRHAPEHEFVVQYEESDWDFLCRWFEQEGYFYWFAHGEDKERLIIADENRDCDPLWGNEHIAYRDKNNLWASGESTVYNWRMKQRLVPARVAVVDYNYRQPRSPLLASADVDTVYGFGCVFSYGEHFRSEKAGKRLATLRAEQYRSARQVFSGETDCPHFQVGFRFVLDGHPHESWGGKEYVITRTAHTAGRAVEGPINEEGEARGYITTFEAIPLEVQFRPEKKTAWPSIHGVIHAHVDSESEGNFADLDNHGRYLVRLPFDLAGTRGKASQRVRMAQPFTGSNHGMHFPLHRGAEVLLAFLDGDPDRPIIVGAVNNPVTPSTSTSANANVYGIRGPGGSFAIESHYASGPGGATAGAEAATDSYESSAWHAALARGARGRGGADGSSDSMGAGGSSNSFLPHTLPPSAPSVSLPPVPALPAIPAAPSIPVVPAMPSVALPSVPAMPNVALPSVPAMPNVALPSVPAPPSPPSVPELPGTGDGGSRIP